MLADYFLDEILYRNYYDIVEPRIWPIMISLTRRHIKSTPSIGMKYATDVFLWGYGVDREVFDSTY